MGMHVPKRPDNALLGQFQASRRLAGESLMVLGQLRQLQSMCQGVLTWLRRRLANVLLTFHNCLGMSGHVPKFQRSVTRVIQRDHASFLDKEGYEWIEVESGTPYKYDTEHFTAYRNGNSNIIIVVVGRMCVIIMTTTTMHTLFCMESL